jgi:hypothetical protein
MHTKFFGKNPAEKRPWHKYEGNIKEEKECHQTQ